MTTSAPAATLRQTSVIPCGAFNTPRFGTMRHTIVGLMARAEGVTSGELFALYLTWNKGHLAECVRILKGKAYGYTIVSETLPPTADGAVSQRFTIVNPNVTTPAATPGAETAAKFEALTQAVKDAKGKKARREAQAALDRFNAANPG